MGPPGKLERDACRMAAALSWQISRDLVLKWAEVMVDAWIGAKRVRNTTTAHQPRHAKLAPGGGIMKTGASMPDCLNAVRQILAAARFAAERHAAQRRKGRTAEPYVNHLSHSSGRWRPFERTSSIICTSIGASSGCRWSLGPWQHRAMFQQC